MSDKARILYNHAIHSIRTYFPIPAIPAHAAIPVPLRSGGTIGGPVSLPRSGNATREVGPCAAWYYAAQRRTNSICAEEDV